MTIRLSADQCTAVIPPVKAVRVRFVENNEGKSCSLCHFSAAIFFIHYQYPCMPYERRDGKTGYWVARKGKRVTP